MANKAAIASELINLQPPSILRSAQTRKKFARELCDALQYWSCEEVSYFVDEMRGLNFSAKSDRQLFLQFLFKWLPIVEEQP